MPIADLVYNSDIAVRPICTNKDSSSSGSGSGCDCSCPPLPPPPPNYPPYAWIIPPPPPNYPCPPCPSSEDNPAVKPNATEKQICKLSKKAATLRSLIENISEKNKPVIIKSGAVSYNLGVFKTMVDMEETEDENIQSIIDMLKTELEKVKEEIKTLSDDLVEE